MQVEEFYPWGEPVSQDKLTIPRAHSLAGAITEFPFTTLLEARRKDEYEGLLVEFQVELPQHPPVPIHSRERVVIAFSPDEDEPPKVYALRKDFPETPHQNLTPLGEPKGLCLFEEEYRDIKPQLTPQMLLQQIADWFRRAAVEKLHLSDQPLEPLLLSLGRIIFDPDIFEIDEQKQALIVVSATSSNSMQVNADKETGISVNLRESVSES